MKALFVALLWLFGCGPGFESSQEKQLQKDAGSEKPVPVVCPDSPLKLPSHCMELDAICTWDTPQYLVPTDPVGHPPVKNCECQPDGGWSCW